MRTANEGRDPPYHRPVLCRGSRSALKRFTPCDGVFALGGLARLLTGLARSASTFINLLFDFRVRLKYPLNRGSKMDHPPTLAHPHALPFAERTTECFFPWVTSASPAGKKSNMPNGWALNVATLKPLSKDSHSFYAPRKGV
jgi:hypothetical protein